MMINFKAMKDRYIIYLGLLSIELYWIRLLHNSIDTGVYAPTQLSIKRSNKYNRHILKWAFVFKILGFGIGLCWDHSENPNLVRITGESN